MSGNCLESTICSFCTSLFSIPTLSVLTNVTFEVEETIEVGAVATGTGGSVCPCVAASASLIAFTVFFPIDPHPVVFADPEHTILCLHWNSFTAASVFLPKYPLIVSAGSKFGNSEDKTNCAFLTSVLWLPIESSFVTIDRLVADPFIGEVVGVVAGLFDGTEGTTTGFGVVGA